MADRYLKQFIQTPDTNKVIIDGYALCTGSADGYEIVSTTLPLGTTVAHTGVGQYTVTLANAYPSLSWFDAVIASSNLAQSSSVLNTQMVSTTVGSATTPVIVFKVLNNAGTAVDPAWSSGGGGFFITIHLKNSGLGVGR